MSKKNVAELLVETLARAGIERIYGVPGDLLNGITDSIRRRESTALAKVLNQSKKITILGERAAPERMRS
jgi:pyruvate dehydrogenase (quinone)